MRAVMLARGGYCAGKEEGSSAAAETNERQRATRQRNSRIPRVSLRCVMQPRAPTVDRDRSGTAHGRLWSEVRTRTQSGQPSSMPALNDPRSDQAYADKIRDASTAALRALSTPTHATGTPGGIWAIDKSASNP